MNLNFKILSDITIFDKYAKYIPSLKRRETWAEICTRYEDMLVKKYPSLSSTIVSYMDYIRNKQILPSMRGLQFAGIAIDRNNARLYNCAYLPIDHYLAFSEIMFLLLGGTGVGYSVQKHHVEKLPSIRKPERFKKYLIGDSLEGWADAIKILMKSYFGKTDGIGPRFDFGDIRPKGSRLVTAGGKAPGPEPLRICLTHIQSIFESKKNGDKLSSLEVHDICCHIANSVLSGGIRRSAMISLFSLDDQEMLTCKYGNWWELNEQRGRANNSAVILRSRIKKKEFLNLWKKVELSRAGEPGIYFTNDIEIGTNPCAEISLRAFQFCNLVEINGSDISTELQFIERTKAAAFFATLQAGFTDFHYLRSIWQKTTEKEALIGVGITGLASCKIKDSWLKDAASVVKRTNKETADRIGINQSARCTTIKPSGTTSCVLGTSSGIHAWYSSYYLRRIRVTKNNPLWIYLSENHSEITEDDLLRGHDTGIIKIPQQVNTNAITRSSESVFDFLERIKTYSIQWIKKGHRSGPNTNNVSATVSIKDSQWLNVGEWMWANKKYFNGLSVLPYDGGTYKQPPFEEISKSEYEKLSSKLKEIDLTKIIEDGDNTEHSQEAACAGGTCSV